MSAITPPSVPTRRGLLGAPLAAVLVAPARAAEPVVIGDWRFEASQLPAPPTEAVLRSFCAQCAIVDGLRIRPEAMAFSTASRCRLMRARRHP